jgi:hypothetical protein
MKFSKGEIICREDLAYPEGALVCDRYDCAGRLLAHPLGGGFQLTVPAQDEPRFRVAAEGDKVLNEPEKGRVDIQLICDDWIKPIETVETEEIELAAEG